MSLLQNISPTFAKDVRREFYLGKTETFLTCYKLVEKLRETVMDDYVGNFFEEITLKAVYKSLINSSNLSDSRLLLEELPRFLKLNYPIVKDICNACKALIPQLVNIFRICDARAWQEFSKYKYTLEMLNTFDFYQHKT